MNKLKPYIKQVIKQALKEEIDPKGLGRIGIITKRFPIVKNALTRLMSKSFVYYIKDLRVVAPKPTTFLVVLKNGLDFNLIYNGAKHNKGFSVKISGKKYDLVNLEDSQRAIDAIANLLSLSPAMKEDTGMGGGAPADAGAAAYNATVGGGGGGGGELPSPASEVPPGTEPTPLGGETNPPGAEIGGGEEELKEIKIQGKGDIDTFIKNILGNNNLNDVYFSKGKGRPSSKMTYKDYIIKQLILKYNMSKEEAKNSIKNLKENRISLKEFKKYFKKNLKK